MTPRDERLGSDLEEQIHDIDREDATLLAKSKPKLKTEGIELEKLPPSKPPGMATRFGQNSNARGEMS
jgi:hypothetical protein